MSGQSWGKIIYEKDIKDPDDPIIKIMDKIEKTRTGLPLEPDESQDEYEQRKADIINKLEHEYSDIIYS